MANEYGTYYPGTNTLVTHSFDERQIGVVEFDDALVDQTPWKNPRYDGSKLTTKKINNVVTPLEGIGNVEIGDTFIIGSDYTSHKNDLYQDLPVVTNKTTAIYLANTVIGGNEDDQFATIKGHSYVGINKILIVNLADDTVQVLDKAVEPFEAFNRFITNDFPAGTSVNVKVLDESISSNLKGKHHVKMNKGYLLKSFTYQFAGEFSGSGAENVLTENNSLYLYEGGELEKAIIQTGSIDSHDEIQQSNHLRFRYAVGSFFEGNDNSGHHQSGGHGWSMNRYGPSYASSSIHENKFTQQYYTGSFGIINNNFDTTNTNAAAQLKQSALGSASVFLGIDSLNFLAQNNADPNLTPQEKTEIHITFFQGTKDFTKGVSQSISKNDERSISTFEVDQAQDQLALGDACNGFLPTTHELKFKGTGLGSIANSRFKPLTFGFEERLNNGYLQSSSLLFYTASNPNTDGCVPITSSLEGGGLSASGYGHHSSSKMMHGIVVDRLEEMTYYVQGGALGEIGRFGCTTASEANYSRLLINERDREFQQQGGNLVNLEGPSGNEAMNIDNFYSGSFHYEMSFLDKDHTLIIDIDKEAELFNGIGNLGVALIPEQLITDVRFNLEYYLNKAGILESGNFNTTANINASYTEPSVN
tara:strand:- start:4908 stop:6842 length:1935 start_codon:yes stop_codon:yes gene_type:complete